MQRFSDLPFKQKVLWITLTSSFAALVLGVLGFFAADLLHFRRAMPRDVQILARIIGDNGRAPLAFNDAKFARDTLLSSLAAHPRITRAALYDGEGNSQRAYDVAETSYVVIIDKTGTIVYTGVGGAQSFNAALRRITAQ